MKIKYIQSASPQILSDLSSFLDKKVGDFNKKESETLDFTGLKIPRDYKNIQRGKCCFIIENNIQI